MTGNRNPASGSLELLLDTICNTFGGILFISMLVVVILNLRSEDVVLKPPDSTMRLRLSLLAEELRESEAKRKALTESELLMRGWIARLDDEAVRKELEALTNEQQRARELQDKKQAMLTRLAATQTAVNDVVANLARTRAEQQKAQADLEAAQNRLRAEQRARGRTARLPVERSTSKRQIAFLLAHGRLHAVWRVENPGVSFNTDEVRVVEEPKRVVPVTGSGTPVDRSGDRSGAVATRFAKWDGRRFYFAIAVWPDSFAHFNTVREVMVRQDIEYQLIPMETDAGVPIGRGAGPGKVQ